MATRASEHNSSLTDRHDGTPHAERLAEPDAKQATQRHPESGSTPETGKLADTPDASGTSGARRTPTAPDANSFIAVAPFYDQLMAGVPYDYWADYIEQLWERHGIKPRTVLDVGCGTGAVTVQLAQAGYDVTGVDLSASMIERAERNADNSGVVIPFACQDAAVLDLPNKKFDSIVSLFDSLNNITEPERFAAALGRARAHLNDPGVFIFDLNTEYAFTTGMFNQRSVASDGPLQYVWKSRYDTASRLCVVDMDFRYCAGNGKAPVAFTETHVQRAYEREEVATMLFDVGFDLVSIYDAYTFKAPRKRSDRLFYVAARGKPNGAPSGPAAFDITGKNRKRGK